MTNVNYWIWLQMALGPGAKIKKIIDEFETPMALFKSTSREKRTSGVLTSSQVQKLESTDIESSYEVISRCSENAIDIVVPTDMEYPNTLLELQDMPAVLYTKGDMSCLYDKIPIAIVGTRRPSVTSEVATAELSASLSRMGFIVVSGGATGIDSAAHIGALNSQNKTVAVLGGGICSDYLKSNKRLREVISQNGVLISELTPFANASRTTFPVRNRIISGITVGTIVVEAGIKSGSLITAKRAMEQNRDVFAVPVEDLSSSYAGTNELIRDGAIAVHEPLDVLRTYLKRFPERVSINGSENLLKDVTKQDKTSTLPVLAESFFNSLQEENEVKTKKTITDNLSQAAIDTYNCFGDEPLDIDMLMQKISFPANTILGALTELEIFGYIEILPNGKYILK